MYDGIIHAHIPDYDEYVALSWPDIQELMDDPRWNEVCYDPGKNLWFVPKDMIYGNKTYLTTGTGSITQ